MKKDSIAYALGQVDEKYIMEAVSKTGMKMRRRSTKWGIIAASLILTVVLGATAAVSAGLLNPLFSYFQGEDEMYLEDILAPAETVSNEKMQLRMEGAIADENACYMVVSFIDLTGTEKSRLESADIHKEFDIYGLLENGERVMGASTSVGTYMQGRKTKSLFPDASQTRVIMYKPKSCGIKDIQKVCFSYDGLVLELEPVNYMSPQYDLAPDENTCGTFTDIRISRVGFSFVQAISEEMSAEDLTYDISLIRTDGTVLSVEEMKEIGSLYSVSFSPILTEAKITGNWGRIPAIAIINLDDYCGVQINGENYYYVEP